MQGELEEAQDTFSIKAHKLQFQQQLEAYMEDEKIHDIFQDMMTSVIKERPKDPIQFLIDRLTQPEKKRIIVVTPPGMKGGDDNMNEEQYKVALMLEQHLVDKGNIVAISVGDLLQREITKKSDYGKRIYESRKKYSYIEDEVVIDLVQKEIEACENAKDSQGRPNSGWILEGFPRTRIQALALQNMKIIPDKFFMLNIADQQSVENLKSSLINGSGGRAVINDPIAINKIARDAIQEYRVNIQGVKDQYHGDIIEIDGNKSKKKIVEEMAKSLKLKKSNAPRKPPKIVLMGPPGVELKEHAKNVSQKYKLVYVDTDQMCKDFCRRNNMSEEAAALREAIKTGEAFADEITMKLLKDRLEMPDCKTNGWVMVGAPSTPEQIQILKDLYQQPSLILALDMSDNLIYDKLEQRRFDPLTNRYHYILSENITDDAVLARLVHKFEDQHPYIKKQLLQYRQFYNTAVGEYQNQLVRINAEQPVKEVYKNMIEAIDH